MLKEKEAKYESLRKELEYKEKVILELKKWLGLQYLEGGNYQKDWDKEATILGLAVKGKLSQKELLVDGLETRFTEIEEIYYYIRGLIKAEEKVNLGTEKKALAFERERLEKGDTRDKERNRGGMSTSVDVDLEIKEIDLKIELTGKEVEMAKLRYENGDAAKIAGLEKEIAWIKKQLEAIGEEKRIRRDVPGIWEAILRGDFESAEIKTRDMLVKKFQAEIKVNKDNNESKVSIISESEKESLKFLFIKYLPKDKLEVESKLDKLMAGLAGEEKAIAQTEIKNKKDVLAELVKDIDKATLEELIEIREIIQTLGD